MNQPDSDPVRPGACHPQGLGTTLRGDEGSPTSQPSCRSDLTNPMWGAFGLPSLGGSTHHFWPLKGLDPESLGLAGLAYAFIAFSYCFCSCNSGPGSVGPRAWLPPRRRIKILVHEQNEHDFRIRWPQGPARTQRLPACCSGVYGPEPRLLLHSFADGAGHTS